MVNQPEIHSLDMFIRRIDGAEIPGGCAHCDAVQTVQSDGGGPNIHILRVVHDYDCPWMAEHARRPQ